MTGGMPAILQNPDRMHEDLTDEERLQHFRVARDQIRARARGARRPA